MSFQTLATIANQDKTFKTVNIRGLYGSKARVMAVLGDSIMAIKASNTANNTYNPARYPSFWIAARTGRRVHIPQDANFAEAGYTTTDVLDNIQPAVDYNAGVYYVAVGTNGSAGGVYNYDLMISELGQIYDALLPLGAIVVAQTILPRNIATAATRNTLQRVNLWIKSQDQVRHRNFHVVDPVVNMVNPLSATWQAKTTPSVYTYDDTHPKTQAAFVVASPGVALINTLIPPVAPALASVADVYDATSNPGGNLLANGILDGTGGTTSGGGGSGGTITATGVATGVIAQHAINGGNFTGLTSTWTKDTMADGRPAQRVVVSGSYTGVGSAIDVGSQIALRIDKTSSFEDYGVGDVFRLEADVEVAAGTEGIASLECQLTFTIGGQNYIIGDGSGFPGDLIGGEAWNGSFRTPDFTLPAGTITLVRCCLRIWLLTGSGITAVLDAKIGGFKLSKVQA